MAESLAELQTRFAAHLRDPQANAAPPDVEDRISEYRHRQRTLVTTSFRCFFS